MNGAGKAICAVAATILLMAAAKPDPDLANGINAYNAGYYAVAFALLSAAAGRGDAQAQVNLGYLYVRGQGVRPDRAEALRLYRDAAEHGDGEAMNAIGYNYQYGNSLVPRDIATAVHWYCRAIEAGNPRAMNNLAILFDTGTGVPQDSAEARSLWRQSAERGHSNGMVNLGESLLSQGDNSGEAWLRRAADLGNGAAQQFLARRGIHGRWPAPFDGAARMQLEPAAPALGHSRYCRQLVS